MNANLRLTLSIIVMAMFGGVAHGYTPPDCDGCAEATPGFQYETYDGYNLYIENYRCDLAGSLQVNSGDDDANYGIDMGYVSLNGCDGEEDTATLTYTKRWGSEYSFNLGFSVAGLTVGTSVTSSYEQQAGIEKPVSCSSCQKGDVTARSVRKHASIVVTVTSTRKYDKVVRWSPIDPPVRTTPFSQLCETAQYTGSGYVYGMAFPEDFDSCDPDGDCICE